MTTAVSTAARANGTTNASRARRAALGSFIGAVVDWYDFLLYGIVAALVFNTQFFPHVSAAMGTLAAFATFGVGFLFRPLGGFIFGHYGDRLGRKRMLVLTVMMMGLSTAAIGLLYGVGLYWLAVSGAVLTLGVLVVLRVLLAVLPRRVSSAIRSPKTYSTPSQVSS